jgi:hypothetical protein
MFLNVFDFDFLLILFNSCVNIEALLDVCTNITGVVFIVMSSISLLVFFSGKVSKTLVRGIITGVGVAIGKQGMDAAISVVTGGNSSGDLPDTKTKPTSTSTSDSSIEPNTDSSTADK